MVSRRSFWLVVGLAVLVLGGLLVLVLGRLLVASVSVVTALAPLPTLGVTLTECSSRVISVTSGGALIALQQSTYSSGMVEGFWSEPETYEYIWLTQDEVRTVAPPEGSEVGGPGSARLLVRDGGLAWSDVVDGDIRQDATGPWFSNGRFHAVQEGGVVHAVDTASGKVMARAALGDAWPLGDDDDSEEDSHSLSPMGLTLTQQRSQDAQGEESPYRDATCILEAWTLPELQRKVLLRKPCMQLSARWLSGQNLYATWSSEETTAHSARSVLLSLTPHAAPLFLGEGDGKPACGSELCVWVDAENQVRVVNARTLASGPFPTWLPKTMASAMDTYAAGDTFLFHLPSLDEVLLMSSRGTSRTRTLPRAPQCLNDFADAGS